MAVLMSPLHLFPLIFKQFAVQGVNSEYSMSLDHFSDLVRGQVQTQREGQRLRLTWRHASPPWAQAYAFESILTRDAGEGYQLTVSPLR